MNQHFSSPDSSQAARALKAHLRREFRQGGTFTLLSLKQKFPNLSANQVGGIVGRFARTGSIRKNPNKANEYFYVKEIPAEIESETMTEAKEVFANKPLPNTAMASALMKAVEEAPAKSVSEALASPVVTTDIPKAETSPAIAEIAKPTTSPIKEGILSISAISEAMLDLAAKVAEAIPDISKIPDIILLEELHRRMKHN